MVHPKAMRRVLVVDDNRDLAESVATLLALSGHEVHRAYDGPSAVETALRVLPQVVFLDVGLPGLDGFEVAKRLRELAALRGLRIVAVTGRAASADRERARECGVDRYFVKPVAPRFLESLLEESRAGALA